MAKSARPPEATSSEVIIFTSSAGWRKPAQATPGPNRTRSVRAAMVMTTGSVYKPHPDPRQEALFFALLRECLETGQTTEEQVRREMAADHVRHDALEVLARAPGLDDILSELPQAA